MCSLTWWSGSGRYEIFFNRDELKSRREGLSPAPALQAGTRYLAPTDPEAGGTWLLANEHGLSLALLNLYQDAPAPLPASRRSRGLLLRDLADCPHIAELARRLKRLPHQHYAPFTLLAFQWESGFQVAMWENQPAPSSGLRGPQFQPEAPITSSSYATREVIAARRQIYRDLLGAGLASPEKLRHYHHFDRGGRAAADTVLMNRPDAQTWAFSHVQVDATRIVFVHEAFPRHLRGPAVTTSLILPRTAHPPAHV